jgi:hypothetical protein
MIKSLFFYAVLLLLAFNAHCQDQIDDIKALIQTKDPGESPRDITFLTRVNMGIPDGDNWLVEWRNEDIDDTNITVYAINGEEVINKFWTSSFDIRERTDFDIMKDIPGTQVGKSSCAVYDYNGDGYDDIFRYSFLGRGYFIEIIAYDTEKNKKVYYCEEIPFEIIDREKGPAPVEFMTYKGMYGFKVYRNLHYGGAPKHPPKNIIDEYYAWYFFSWNGREFVEVEEVEEDGIGSPRSAEEKRSTAEFVNEEAASEEETAKETEYHAVEDGSQDRPPYLKAGILFGIIILVVIIGIVVSVRKKGKRKITE